MSDLTAKQARFVEEYVIDLNATQAAIRAGYSRNGADTTGPRLLEDPRIIAAIDARKIERSERTEINADWVLKRLANEAEADINDIYDENGGLKPVKEWPKIWRQGLIAGIDTEEITVEGVKMGIVRKVKVSDRVRRLELIGKHVRVNAFQDQVKVTGFDGLADRLERAKRRPTAAPVQPAAQPSPVEPKSEPEVEPHPLHERLRRASEREVRPDLKPDWQEPETSPVYAPILPWPEANGSTETEYDVLSGTLLSARRDT
ncbi:terminase small subunit [Sinorhizobium meliloti]|uniref:terminase small subunit n=1 Tax=Rhizobium meliloti TaxID=382 RepID=UPI000FD4E42D|nr:terminase small subunit [Sinorhizobium meliloti]RVJ79203.1 hypothetical protein CN171_03940 [Sinorhizobium meliloti]